MKIVKLFIFLGLFAATIFSVVKAEDKPKVTPEKKQISAPNQATLPPTTLLNLSEEIKHVAPLKPVGKLLKKLAKDAKKKQEIKEEKEKESKKIHWGYEGKGRPEFWASLSKKYLTCNTGKNQSPISLRENEAVGTTGLDGFDVYYRDSSLKIINDGHALQVNYPLGSYIMLKDIRYELLSFSFHTPSEHKLNGFNYPMEMQMMHKDSYGNLAVVAIIFQEGETNLALQDIIRKAPKKAGKQKVYPKLKINPNKFFPAEKEFYKYSGSLTTPPCTEGVYWMVFKRPVEASAEQIDKMMKIMGQNNRPVQKTNSRSILKSWKGKESRVEENYEFY